MERRHMLKRRYVEIQYQLAGKPLPEAWGGEASGPTPSGLTFDPNQFEPEPSKAGKPIVIQERRSVGQIAARVLKGSGFVRMGLTAFVLLVVLSVALLVGMGGLSFYLVPTKSMVPTLMPDDHIVALTEAHYKRGDIIIIPDPESPGDYLVKRLIAFGGDEVAVRGGKLYVNGKAINEPYLREQMQYRMPPMKVGKGNVFLLGDNRNDSEDSHLWHKGLPLKEIKGKVVYIYSPAKRRRKIADFTSVFAGV